MSKAFLPKINNTHVSVNAWHAIFKIFVSHRKIEKKKCKVLPSVEKG